MKQKLEQIGRKITVTLMNHRFLRYLLILPTVLVMAHAFYSVRLNDEIINQLLREKFVDNVDEIRLIGSVIDDFVERDGDWDSYDYTSIISNAAVRIDALPFTFAAAYDSELNMLSSRQASYDTPFDPLIYPEFLQSVSINDDDTLIVTFTPDNGEMRDIYVCFRWVPSLTGVSNRTLIVVGISWASIATPVTRWVAYGNVILSVITALCNYLMIAVLYSSSALSDDARRKEGTRHER